MGLMYNLQSCVNRVAIPGDIITLRLANESSAFVTVTFPGLFFYKFEMFVLL